MRRFSFLLWMISAVPLFGHQVILQDLHWSSDSAIQFDIQWQHSWRYSEDSLSGNWDGIWLFAKIQDGSGLWHHAHFSPTQTAHTVSDAAFELTASSDRMGTWLRRASAGFGNTPMLTASLTFDQPFDTAKVAVRLFAVEMVWIPEGPFWVGDSISEHTFRSGSEPLPFLIDTDSVIETGANAGKLWDDGSNPPSGHIPASFPAGYSGFWMMKYELSQAQYADFLNCLTFGQQQGRTSQSPAAQPGSWALASNPALRFRNGIAIEVAGVAPNTPARYGCDGNGNGLLGEVADGQNRAANLLNWADVTAYLDWAGLRPMTELEFEKAARGPLYPLAREFAWGTAEIVDANTLTMDGTPFESVTEMATGTAGLGSHGYLGPQGPLRVGFGGAADSDRLQAGAGYWGIWELSGNLWEIVVALNGGGLSFDGTHGDGALDVEGKADVPTWPVTTGAGYRGGAWNSAIQGEFRDLAVSDRFYMDLFPGLRRNTGGGRGVRNQ
ncbi:SUMF1/EgtB/PvdO family nonheme iron enzyme [Pontibacter sp. G13]|uniref:SUMF1/EgtB/PvdO family nonheme iron enzyme n=1 Tax=Pontibacter sp. G13 TaxID=3074898 RepID=UPI00288AC8E4|nr:SUMF1/EgtB/PvdO family nonheme iron enzyme [Pontibacter sp. G13]WNJ19218.1 SUMF1/EgtB/PvdO family nonheme iron enzyme [Pontibacter sp. G13]